MISPSSNLSSAILISFLLTLLHFLSLGPTSKATPTYSAILCPNSSTYSPSSTYETNLNYLLIALSNADPDGFFNYTAGKGLPDPSYGLFLCRGDLSSTACDDCVTAASTEVLRRCPQLKSASIWYNECMLRYSDTYIFSAVDITYNVMLPGAENVTEQPGLFSESLKKLMGELSTRDSLKTQLGYKKFATGELNLTANQTLYGLLQCTPDITSADCDRCITAAVSNLWNCCDGKHGGRVLYTSCNVRYETNQFYSLDAPPTPLAPPLPLPPPPPPPPTSGKDEITTLRSLQYDLSMIRAVTNNFSDDNKIGMGGFGPVYKGTLPNGQEVALKRLSKNSRQGVQQFKNEVVLIAQIQHANLVRLLGFCSEEEEKILIYEFLPNKSLDKFLFDSQEQEKLDWPQRYKIIQGIAQGMLYLHEYSRLRIIHRDLKSGNILLDGAMNAKISDFGMARIFGVDQTQAVTSRVVGTYGYISPEYAMHGQFSVKSDVFSFGVVLLEIISGKKTNSFYNPDCVENLLSYAWKLWKDGTPLDLMDPALEGSYSRNEVNRCIHIGLLCAQPNPDARPSMAKVVRMLNSYSTMSLPQQPAFFARNRTTSSALQGLEPDRPIDKPMTLPVNEESIAELDHR
ncbi:cysteine-rich receptor-like protein kinase 25 isoform X2 [Rhododendron vialii]|uniref:cysteine-rich receptor-like protein kinase 25 isoform X2 n=1 Tax=Rhododendron vialii TaxID=182163 RepID=UPI00265EABB3|nr:cysteine-rich receptor-like protein kinase 25 isoform X2 [Rhododendron vialii]